MANHKGNYIKQSVATHQEKDDYTQGHTSFPTCSLLNWLLTPDSGTFL